MGLIDIAHGIDRRPISAGQDLGQEDVDAACQQDVVGSRQAAQQHVADAQQDQFGGSRGHLKAEVGLEVRHAAFQVQKRVCTVIDGGDLHHLVYEGQEQGCRPLTSCCGLSGGSESRIWCMSSGM